MGTSSRRWLGLVVLAAGACGRSESPSSAAIAEAGAGSDTGAVAADVASVRDAGAGSVSLAQTYARAGVVTGSCMPDDGINRHVARLWDPLEAPRVWSRLSQQAQCLASAGGGCAALITCLGYE